MNEKNGTEILIAAQDVPLEMIEAYPEATDHVAKELELKLSETIFTRLHDGGTYAISVQAIKRDMAPTNSIRFERNLILKKLIMCGQCGHSTEEYAYEDSVWCRKWAETMPRWGYCSLAKERKDEEK